MRVEIHRTTLVVTTGEGGPASYTDAVYIMAPWDDTMKQVMGLLDGGGFEIIGTLPDPLPKEGSLVVEVQKKQT